MKKILLFLGVFILSIFSVYAADDYAKIHYYESFKGDYYCSDQTNGYNISFKPCEKFSMLIKGKEPELKNGFMGYTSKAFSVGFSKGEYVFVGDKEYCVKNGKQVGKKSCLIYNANSKLAGVSNDNKNGSYEINYINNECSINNEEVECENFNELWLENIRIIANTSDDDTILDDVTSDNSNDNKQEDAIKIEDTKNDNQNIDNSVNIQTQENFGNCTINGEPVPCEEAMNKGFSILKWGLNILILLSIISFIFFIFTIAMLVHAVKNPIKLKPLWIIILLFVPYLGVLLYYFAVKRSFDKKQIPNQEQNFPPSQQSVKPQTVNEPQDNSFIISDD